MNSKILMDVIYEEITLYYKIDFKDLSRVRCVADAKKMFCTIARSHGMTYQKIADYIGYSNHSSAFVAIQEFEYLRQNYAKPQYDYNTVRMHVEERIEAIDGLGILG